MDWLKRMNGALDYIEDNLAGEIDYNTAAGIACCSVYHFQRMFSYMVDIPLSEYIRRRRLTLAAFELQTRSIKILDLALKYGYDSPEAFTRAYQKLHGVAPSLSRQKGISLKSYPRLSFHITLKGAEEMNYRMIEKEAFAVFGVEEFFPDENEDKQTGIPDMWRRCMQDGTIGRIGKAAGRKQAWSGPGLKPVYGAFGYPEEGQGSPGTPYLICADMPESGLKAEDPYAVVEIPAQTWAVFTSAEHLQEKSVDSTQDLWKRIYTEWFPMSSYEPLSGPLFEKFGIAESGLSYCEIWVPVRHI
ncbi:AraC family transcriptional regulator [Paenibacillus sp. S-38]|uniref:AraC family transcriptional regulator n=1 Tax=Paenibacillus sp. S-38 TaxID=3416710 RepID=UPI003CF824BA